MNFDNKKYMDDTGAKKLISLVQDAITALDEGKANKTNTVNNVQYRVGNSITQSINGTDTTIVYVTDTPTENSNALITAGGVKNALDNVEPTEMTAAQVQTIWDSVPGGGSGGGDSMPYTNHNSGFRGKNLGTTFTAEQKAAIADGSFNDLYVGDYWTFDETVWRIIDIDTFFKFGYPKTNTHHVVIMPDTSLTSSAWGSGYFPNSTIATTVIPQLVSDFENTVGTYLINQAYINIGADTNWVQYKMMLPCLSNIFGHCELRESPISTNSHPFMQSQFALFRYIRNFINQQDNVNVWTTDYNSNLNANLVVDLNGYYCYNGLSTVNGIRPYALLAGVDQSQE